MTLRHLKIFVTVCQEKSITLAAQKLFISQPAVSNAIKELEVYYETPLFDRISKKLYLTEAGNKVFEYAIHINSLFDELHKVVKDTKSGGSLKIGASITIGTNFMPDYIQRFSMLHPEIDTFVSIASSDIIEKLILENELDIALIEGVIHSPNLIAKEFIKDELVVICSANNSLLNKAHLDIEDLSSQNFLMRDKNSGTRELAESILLLHNISLSPIWESSSTQAIINGVSKNLGISILPLKLVQDSITSNQIKILKINGLNFQRQYQLIYHKNKYLTNAALEFIDMLFSY